MKKKKKEKLGNPLNPENSGFWNIMYNPSLPSLVAGKSQSKNCRCCQLQCRRPLMVGISPLNQLPATSIL
jgi:hypothetical protein